MTSNTKKTPNDNNEFTEKFESIIDQSQNILKNFIEKQGSAATGSPDPLNLANAFSHYLSNIAMNPAKFMETQCEFWKDYMDMWQNSISRFLGQEQAPFIQSERGDRRFSDEGWDEVFIFDFIKQSYLITAKHLRKASLETEGLDEKEAQKVSFYTQQLIDAISPTNFVMTNPAVLKKTMETGGENLMKGLQNLLDDVEKGKVKMADEKAFKVGETLAITPGKVVFQNDLLQLIQYEPTTKKVNKTPLLIAPPWINKFYILDLQPKNSFVKYAVDQGNTTFMISWKNPDEKIGRETKFEDYFFKGLSEALDAVAKATGEKQANVIGYCIGGTMLSAGLAYMQAKKDTRVKSATFFTTLTDFSDPGDLGVFVDEEQISALENKMEEKGFLPGQEMATTFNMLRSNDLIWSFVVNNYLMGEQPFPFDLLYWNSDSTNLPCAMHSFYLRKMYLENKLVEKGGIKFKDTPIDLTTVKTPSFFISTREDHIAPWRTTYATTQMFKGPIKFVLSGSGHIAGIINPPEKNKYGYMTNDKLGKTPDEYLKGAKEHEGSWWGHWSAWLEKEQGGGKVDARKPGGGKLKAIEDAPGSYVKESI